MAEPDTNTDGGVLKLTIALARVSVDLTLLFRISFLYFLVQRWSPTPAPARCTMAVEFSRTSKSTTPLLGSHCDSFFSLGARRTSFTTSIDFFSASRTSAEPIKPVAPVTTSFMKFL